MPLGQGILRPTSTGAAPAEFGAQIFQKRPPVSPNAVNISPWVARSNLFGRVQMGMLPEFQHSKSHRQNSAVSLRNQRNYEDSAGRGLTVLGGALPRGVGRCARGDHLGRRSTEGV